MISYFMNSLKVVDKLRLYKKGSVTIEFSFFDFTLF